jgi:hypothetical protein
MISVDTTRDSGPNTGGGGTGTNIKTGNNTGGAGRSNSVMSSTRGPLSTAGSVRGDTLTRHFSRAGDMLGSSPSRPDTAASGISIGTPGTAGGGAGVSTRRESTREGGRRESTRESTRDRTRQASMSSPSLHGPDSPVNPEITMAKTLNEHTKALEQRVDREVRDSRSYLKSVFQSLQTGQYSGEVEFKLRTFLRLKADARCALTFLRDVVSVQTVNDGGDRAIFAELDTELISFEKKFDGFEDQGRQNLFE